MSAELHGIYGLAVVFTCSACLSKVASPDVGAVRDAKRGMLLRLTCPKCNARAIYGAPSGARNPARTRST